jgi:polysaccharide export outer membrane protein
VFVIRQIPGQDPQIFRVDLSSPSGFLSAGNFYLTDNDIVYVNAKGTTRWNRVISQFFPFSSFLNSIDNLVDD